MKSAYMPEREPRRCLRKYGMYESGGSVVEASIAPDGRASLLGFDDWVTGGASAVILSNTSGTATETAT